MRRIILKKCNLLVFLVAGMTALPVYAEKPSWAGGGKGGKQTKAATHGGQKSQQGSQKSRKDSHGAAASHPGGGKKTAVARFDDRQRSAIHGYYAEQISAGHCPPGLAKKGNGCMPPGQAKKWAIGSPLPPDVIYYDLPPQVVLEIGPPPLGYRFVRVANDILMMAVGTGMIVDAITDLGGL